MNTHDYTPERALEILLQKVKEKDVYLASRIQSAIDAGTDISKEDVPIDDRGKTRSYRKTVPFSHGEALQIATSVLQACFVEIPSCINSAVEAFKVSAIGSHVEREKHIWPSKTEPDKIKINASGEPKKLQVELKTETQLTVVEHETLPLTPVSTGDIESELVNIERVRNFISFKETKDDDHDS